MIGSHNRRKLIAALPLAGLAGRLHASTPGSTGTISMVIAFAPGGSVDAVARPLAERMSKSLGQSVIVMNRPGGQTNIATQSVVSAAPDGRTIYFGSSSMFSNPHFGPAPGVDVLEALTPLTAINSVPFMIAAHPSVPADDPKSFIELARQQPDKLMIGSAGLERSAWELGRGAKIKLTHVAYKGGALATADTIAGHINLVIASIPVLLPFVRRGELKAIGVCADERAAVLPDVPTFVEAGVKDYPIAAWYGLYAPKDVPQAAADRLADAARRAVDEPDFRQSMVSQGVAVLGGTRQDLDRLRRKTYEDFAILAKAYKG